MVLALSPLDSVDPSETSVVNSETPKKAPSDGSSVDGPAVGRGTGRLRNCETACCEPRRPGPAVGFASKLRRLRPPARLADLRPDRQLRSLPPSPGPAWRPRRRDRAWRRGPDQRRPESRPQRTARLRFPRAQLLRVARAGEWNSYRIQVTGSEYAVWLNEVLVNRFVSTDSRRSLQGVLGMQAHDADSTVDFPTSGSSHSTR